MVGAPTGTPALRITETERNTYNVAMPAADPGEPFAIRLATERSGKSGSQYRDALTYVRHNTPLHP